ncbi:MAG: efflux transporter periplasmic adaptor subunit, partial [Oceanicaulis sp.]|nr:efflux transporter periplasmic adaptor subunit [Oceanicaulis sp.]
MSADRRDQLRSLSIDRDEQTGRGGGVSLPVLIGAMAVSAALAGGAIWYFLSDDAPAPAPAPAQTAQAPASGSAGNAGAAETPPARAPRGCGGVGWGDVVGRRPGPGGA